MVSRPCNRKATKTNMFSNYTSCFFFKCTLKNKHEGVYSCILVCFSVVLIKAKTKSNLGRKEFMWRTLPHHNL